MFLTYKTKLKESFLYKNIYFIIMLKNKKIEVYISYRNITHYKKLGYNPELNENLEIDVYDLPTSSHVKIDAICEICKAEINIRYHKYIENKKRHGFYGCKKCSRQKASLTMFDKYGVYNVSELEECKNKKEETYLKKYGYKTNLISPDYISLIKEKLKEKYNTENWYEIRNGQGSPKKLIIFAESKEYTEISFNYDNQFMNSDYIMYRNEVRRLTKTNEKLLFQNWNGEDFYDKEIISNNFILDFNDPNYPTIDHKISIYYGFKNNMQPKDIAKIENLCITKRSINSSKNSKNESEFIRED
jgi:hypothetical protein